MSRWNPIVYRAQQCSWCGHGLHSGRCARTTQTKQNTSEPCKCARRTEEKNTDDNTVPDGSLNYDR